MHNVYGQMYYYEGLWYYLDYTNNKIVCSDIYGKHNKTVIIGSGNVGTLSVTGIENGVMQYKDNGTNKTYSLK